MSLIRSLADKMSAHPAPADIWPQAVACLPQIGLSKVVFMDLSTRKDPLILSNACDGWIAGYRDTVRAGLDPFASNCLTSLASQPTGIDHLERHQHLPQDALDQIAHGSAELDIRTGMSVTILPDAQGAGVGANLMTDLNVVEFNELRLQYEDTWRAWCQLVYAGMSQSESDGPILTDKERDCLAHIADGMRITEVAYTLGISEGTVELHLRKARTRLGAKTRDQAVAMAVRARAI